VPGEPAQRPKINRPQNQTRPRPSGRIRPEGQDLTELLSYWNDMRSMQKDYRFYKPTKKVHQTNPFPRNSVILFRFGGIQQYNDIQKKRRSIEHRLYISGPSGAGENAA
jgi:hypothetical protein